MKYILLLFLLLITTNCTSSYNNRGNDMLKDQISKEKIDNLIEDVLKEDKLGGQISNLYIRYNYLNDDILRLKPDGRINGVGPWKYGYWIITEKTNKEFSMRYSYDINRAEILHISVDFMIDGDYKPINWSMIILARENPL